MTVDVMANERQASGPKYPRLLHASLQEFTVHTAQMHPRSACSDKLCPAQAWLGIGQIRTVSQIAK